MLSNCIVTQITYQDIFSKTISSPRESLKPQVNIIFFLLIVMYSLALFHIVWISDCQTFLLTEESFFSQMNPTIWHIHRPHIQRTLTWLKAELLFEVEAGSGPETLSFGLVFHLSGLMAPRHISLEDKIYVYLSLTNTGFHEEQEEITEFVNWLYLRNEKNESRLTWGLWACYVERRIIPLLEIKKLGKVYTTFSVIICEQYGDPFHNTI